MRDLGYPRPLKDTTTSVNFQPPRNTSEIHLSENTSVKIPGETLVGNRHDRYMFHLNISGHG